MRLLSTAFAGLVFAAMIPTAWAAQNPPAPKHHGMTREEAFNYCRAQNPNRQIEMRQCVIAKMRGE